MRDVFAMMAEELEGSYLEVVKIPGRYGGYIRVPVSVNAEWYRVFCKQYLSTRRRFSRPRTLIKRGDTLKALVRLSNRNFRGVYAERLLDFVNDWYDKQISTRREVNDESQVHVGVWPF